MLLIPICLLLIIITAAVWAYSEQLRHYATVQKREAERQALQTQTSTSLVLLHKALATTTSWQHALTSAERRMVSHHQVSIRDAKLTFFTLSATAQNKASTMVHSRSMKLLRFPLLQALPHVPLLLSATVSAKARITLFPADFSAAGYWNQATLTTPQAPQLQCDSVVTSDCQPLIASYDKYPSDVFTHLFGISRSAFSPDSLPGTTILSECSHIAATQARVLWINGNCDIPRATAIGTQSHPVVLVVENGHLNLAESSVLTGILVTLSRNSILPRDIIMSPTSMISGAAILSQPLSSRSNVKVRFSTEVLTTLQNSEYFQRTVFIPGSWHDF